MNLRGRALIALAVAVLPVASAAQDRLRFRPSLAVAQAYDDNLFASATRPQADRILSVLPALAIAYTASRFAADASWLAEAQKFGRATRLDSPAARWAGTLSLRYAVLRGVSFDASVRFARTRTPGEFAPDGGLDLGRREASQLSSVERLRFGRRTSLTLSHAVVRDAVQAGPAGTSHWGALVLARRISERTRWSAAYEPRLFASAGHATVSHGALVGLLRALSRSTDLDLAAGPRFTERRTEPELRLGLRRRFRRGALGLSLAKDETRIVGQTGVARTESATLAVRGSVARGLHVSLSPGVIRLRQAGGDTTTWGLASELGFRVSRSLTVVGAHRYLDTRGGLVGGGAVSHSVFQVRLELSPATADAVAEAER